MCESEIEMIANERLRATDEDIVDRDMDKLDDVSDDTCQELVVVPSYFIHHYIPMIRKPMPTACEMRMNSLLSGSKTCISAAGIRTKY